MSFEHAHVFNALQGRSHQLACMLATAAAAAAALLQLKPLTITVEDEAVYAVNELLLIIVVCPASCIQDHSHNELLFTAFTRPQRPAARRSYAELCRSLLL
jgi:hypothetical protein